MEKHKSPCIDCIVWACCSRICRSKLNFTAERYTRLKSYLKEDYNRPEYDSDLSKLMSDIWKENSKISQRDEGRNLYTPFGSLIKKFREDIEKDPQRNIEFCESLIISKCREDSTLYNSIYSIYINNKE